MKLFSTLFFSFLIAICWFILPKPKDPMQFEMLRIFFYLFYTASPALFSYLFAKKESLSLPFFKPWNGYVAYAFFIPFLSNLFLLIIGFFLSEFFLPQTFLLLFFISFFTFFLTLIGISGEEIFFRGYLVKKWKNLSFWKLSFAIGLSFSIWSIPLIVFQAHVQWADFLLPVNAFIATPLMILLRKKAHTIFAPALFYTTYTNTMLFFSHMLFRPYLLVIGNLLILLFINLIIWKKQKSLSL